MADTYSVPVVITEVVDNDLCIGCGVCADACPNSALDIRWNEYGFLTAYSNGNACGGDGACIQVCPFNPAPAEQYKDEDKLAKIFLKEVNEYHPKTGKYVGLYAGYSKQFRVTSSSGGIATYLYDRLFEKGLIDHVITVGEATGEGTHYEYRVISRKDELLSTSKTRYYPVTLAGALKVIRSLHGKVAVSGVACFIKAIRLAQAHDPVLREKITFLSGIICGGVKSRFFTEYLVSKAGAEQTRFIKPEYRVKDILSTASDYGFSCTNIATDKSHFIKMREVGDMWGTGLFKANACDYCDDVTTELADVSLGDAWLEPYNGDGNGHNVIVARSPLVNQILEEGRNTGELELEHLSLDRFLASQQGSFNHRHDGMALRVALAKKSGVSIAPKRHDTVQLPLRLRLVQLARLRSRAKSLEIWREQRDASGFDRQMKLTLLALKILTKASRGINKLKRLIGMSS